MKKALIIQRLVCRIFFTQRTFSAVGLFVFIFSVCMCFGQGENNTWYFGYGAGVDFNSGSPVAISGGQTAQREGVASVSDASGNLLFYSDGLSVWDRTHSFMPNGTGLMGDPSSTQSATIVPIPGNANQYYLFTCPAINSSNGLRYSIVDMTLNAGNGDIAATKNVLLLNSTTEQCTTVPATNGCVWFITRKFNPVFYSYLIDITGIHPPVISNCGSVFMSININGLGYMKPSPLNNKIAIADYGASSAVSFFELYDFDNTTGSVSNAIQLSPPTNVVYGCSFSPDGTKFYGALWGPSIYQFDLTAGSAAAIQATETLIGNTNGTSVGAMQIGPDQKIYVTSEGDLSLSVIDNPNALGTACNFIFASLPLNGGTCGIGLPSIVQSVCNVMPTAAFFAPHHICPGTCTDFINNSQNATTYLWSFPGASPSTSTDANPVSICYNTPGNYTVSLIATNASGSDTLMLNNYITVYPYPAPQGIAQSGDTLFANAGAVSYQWYHGGVLIPGATDYFYLATSGGDYNVVATDANHCEVEAAIFDVVAAVQSMVNDLSSMVYPNPVVDKLVVTSSLLVGAPIEITIYNLLGEKVLAVSPLSLGRVVGGEAIDCRLLPSGIYYLEVTGSEIKFRKQFVKQ